MRQILGTSNGVIVARMPRPSVERGGVLVRLHYSFVSPGTELSPMRAVTVPGNLNMLEKVKAYGNLSQSYLGAAIRNPRNAVRFAMRLAKDQISVALPSKPKARDSAEASDMDDLGWNLGYSAAGEVIQTGEGVADLVAGDMVACAGAGQANHADYISVQRNLVVKVPRECSMVSAATTTVGAIALQGVRRAAPQLGERIAVLGLGLIGQLTVQMLRAAGCIVIGLDLNPERVGRAVELGMNAGASDSAEFKTLIRDATEGWGADRTLITAATKSDEVINLAMDITRPKGAVVIVGDVGLNVRREVFYRKEIDLLMSTSYGPGRYDYHYEQDGHDYPFAYVRWTLNRNMQAYLQMIAAGQLNIESVIDRVTPVEDAPKVYGEALHSPHPPLGIIIRYDAGTAGAEDAPRVVLRGHRKPPQDRIRYALVGAGAFGTSMLTPQMDKRKDRFFLKGVVSRDTTRGGNFARANKVEVVATDLAAILKDPDFDLVVIATRHHEHADMTVQSAAAGKDVFVEKPLALTWSELDRVIETYESLDERPLLMVGFNRRFSPAIHMLQQAITSRRSPLMIHYRVNAKYIPSDHWVHSPQGGGRNLGEACHMYDVFRFLTGARVRTIQAASIDPGNLPYNRNDNFTASLTYDDGSVGTLIYTALGPDRGLAKERIEVFVDGQAYIVDDFKSLVRASDGKILWQSSESNKGHFEELSQFGDAIAGGKESPIPFDEIIETSAVALHVEDLIHGMNPGS